MRDIHAFKLDRNVTCIFAQTAAVIICANAVDHTNSSNHMNHSSGAPYPRNAFTTP